MKKLFILLLPLFAFSQGNCILPADNSDFKKNWEAVCKCIEDGKIIEPTQTYRLYADAPFFTNNDIIVKGIGKEKSGLIFENPIIYFVSERGVNMSFENVTIATGDYDKFKDNDYLQNTKFNTFYKLQEVKQDVSVDFIKFNNCLIGGSLQVILNEGNVKSIEVQDSRIEYPYNLLAISANPQETRINRNDVYNVRQSVFKLTGAGGIYANDNNVENDYIAEPGMSYRSGYITFIQSNGADRLIGRRNTFKNMLSRSGAVVYPVYPSVKNLIWEDNESIDCFSISDDAESTLVKLKQVGNVNFNRNKVEITRKALVKLGLLAVENSPIETVSTQFEMCLFSASNDYLPGYTTEIKDNELTTPFINMASHLMSDNHTISGNRINIEYIAPLAEPSVFFRENLLFNIEGNDRGYFKFNTNTLNIGKAYKSAYSVVGFKKSTHESIENCNNSYYSTEPLKVSFGRISQIRDVGSEGRSSKIYKATGNFIDKGTIEDVAAINFEGVGYPFTEIGNVHYTIGQSSGDAESHIANLESFGKTQVEVLQYQSDTFGVFRFLNSDFVTKTLNPYFADHTVLLFVKITALNIDGSEETLSYTIDVQNRTLLYSDAKFPVIERTSFSRNVANIENKPSKIKLVHRNFRPGDASYLTFEGLKNYRSFNVSVSVQKN